MCESCTGRVDRREFLVASSALGAAGLVANAWAGAAPQAAPRTKTPARIRVVFLYPPLDVVNSGKMEDSWASHNWFTWPGNQFQPEQQQQTFTQKIREMAARIGVTVEFAPEPVWQKAKIQEFIEQAKASPLDAVLVVNFWNTLSKSALEIATTAAPTAIVYHSVGSNHQLPPESLRTAEGIYYIHSIENWAEIERGLRAVHARKMLAQSKLLRVSGKIDAPQEAREKLLEMDILSVPAAEFNNLFDSIAVNDATRSQAKQFRQQAQGIADVSEEYLLEAFRAHQAVQQILARYAADAVTVQCLFLEHRKPCVSFAVHNGQLVPCGCENDLNATLTLMLGRWLLGRSGFQHNPEFDTSENRYFGAHCTCAWHLHGPQGPAQPYLVRPFFHQLPKTAALDVQWTPHEPILLTKYLSGQDKLYCWTGKVIDSPKSPPTGGCATRVLAEIDEVRDVCQVYSGPHPVLFCGDRNDARVLKTFARMYRLKLEGNV